MKMKITGVLLGLIALVTLLSGCGGGGGGGGSDTGTSGGNSTTINGKVLDSAKSDVAVGGATVQIGGATAMTTTVDQASATNTVGSFTIKGAATGATTAIITAPGIAAQTVAFYPPISTGTTSALTLTINIGQVRGRILGPDGTPAANAFVSINSAESQSYSFTTGTNADGTFFFDLVPKGAAQISVARGTDSATVPLNVVNGVNEAGDTRLVATTNTNPPGLAYDLVGTITIPNQPANAGAGTTVLLYRNGTLLEQTTADANSFYGFYVPAGNYTVKTTRLGYQDGSKDVAITAPSTAVRADFSLVPK